VSSRSRCSMSRFSAGTLSPEFQEPSQRGPIHAAAVREATIRHVGDGLDPMPREAWWRKGSGGVRAVTETLLRGFLKLWRKGWRVYSAGMRLSTLIGHRGEPAVGCVLLGPVGRRWSVLEVQFLSAAARTPAQVHSLPRQHTRMPYQSQSRQVRVLDRSIPTATRDSYDPESEDDTGLNVAKARSHPQITHARATPLPMSTCRQGGR